MRPVNLLPALSGSKVPFKSALSQVKSFDALETVKQEGSSSLLGIENYG